MKATIVNFRGGRHTQYNNHMILKPTDSAKREDAEKLVGKAVTYACTGKAKATIEGKVMSAHGNSGCVRAIFERGMPGQAVGKEVEVQ
jgi:large subunit ribosomal protein L35Ae